MYSLIYEDHHIGQTEKKVISVHKTREESDDALLQRQNKLGKKFYECNTRVIWTDKPVAAGDLLKAGEFVTWRLGEDIPEG